MSTKIILDACLNHNGDLRNAYHMIEKAKESGADYIKFQAINSLELNREWPNYKENFYYYQENELKPKMYAEIVEKCKAVGINLLFTAFTINSAKSLLSLGQKEVKIASPDADNWNLVDYCIKNFDRVFVSTGMIDNKNLVKSRSKLRKQDVLFYCISMYPTPESKVDFDKMVLFDGFSDHTVSIDSAKKAIDLGVEWVERHFTLGKDLPGRDHKLSSTPTEVKELCDHRNYVDKCELFKRRWVNG